MRTRPLPADGPRRCSVTVVFAAALATALALPVQAKPAGPEPEALIAAAADAGEGTWKKVQGPAPNLTSRELFTYALALAEAGQHPDRLATLLRVAARMQDRHPESRGYGNFRWSWHHTEVMDRNAVEFCMQGGALLWMRHRDTMPDAARKTLAEILDYAVEGCMRHGVGPAYTNIALMNAENLILLGETLGRPDVADEGYRRFDAFLLHTYEHGISEYASPCYYGVDLDCLVLIERFGKRERTREQARALLELFWTDVAAHFFPPSGRLAGPHSRDYNYLHGNGSVLDNHLYVEGWLPEGRRNSLGLLWPALAGWHPPLRLHEMSRERVPRLVRQSWREAPHQARTHYVLEDVTLGSAAANYHRMDLPLTVDLPGDARFPRCYFIPDARHDPYGRKRIPVGGGHAKTIHLRPFWTAAQRRTDALGLVLYRNEPQTRDAETLESHFVMPKAVDGFWVGDRRIDVSGSKPAEWPVEGTTPVVLRHGTAAVGVRVLWACRADGGEAPIALVYDGNAHGAVRLTVAHHAGGLGDDVTRAGAALWVRVAGALETDGDLATFREAFACAEVKPAVFGNRLLFEVAGGRGTLRVEAGYPVPGTPTLVPAPSRAVLAIGDEDVGRQILEQVEPIRSYVAAVQNAPPVVLSPDEDVYVEAESGYAVPSFVVADDPKASGGRFAWTPGEPAARGHRKGQLIWRVRVPRPGDWYVWGRVQAPSPSDDSFFLNLRDESGALLRQVEWHTGTRKTWQWIPMTDHLSRKPAVLSLPMGTLRMELATREDGTKLDRLFFTRDTKARPE